MSSTGQPPASLGGLLLDQVRRLGHQPLLTYYSEVTGERTELSYATFDNWASKTANLLAEECDAGRGSRVALGVTGHWTGAAIVAAAWKLGAAVVAPDASDAEILVVAESAAQRHAGRTGLVVIGEGMGGRVTGDVDGIAYGDEVLAFGDDYDDPAVSLDDPAVDLGGRTRTQGELLREVTGALGSSDRLLSTVALDSAGGIGLGLLAPVAGGASVVWCPGMDAAAATRHAENERATHVIEDDTIRLR